MIFCFTAVSAVAPSLFIVWYFHRRDLYPEPGRVLWTTFALGVLIVLPVIAVELVIQAAVAGVSGPLARGALGAFLVAACTEEAFKLLVLMTYVWRHREFNEPMDGIVYGVVASLGFATLENVLYVSSGGAGVAVMRALSSVPMHASVGAIMGYFVGQARFARSGRAALVLAGFAAAFTLHGFYDFPLMSLSAAAEIAKSSGAQPEAGLLALLPGTLLALALAVVWALVLSGRARKLQLRQSRQIFAPPPLVPAAPTVAPASYRRDDDVRPAPAPGTSADHGRVVTLAMLGMGFALGSGGGMFALAVALAFAMGMVAEAEAGMTLAGAALVGLLPMAAGAVLFTAGISRLNQRPRVTSLRPGR